ncbi:MarR family transcriptional regulator [Skermanella mucosa]|uniref:HVO_A0114 family putative DNA-binding protein n=1 Tax=Skermanella mucosa TaxID=1789672 RepID=UPI001E4057A0|nr:helix-turn-helix domain-containing protein [Skermanella mucosa]UEM21090.1 MarR family transcriptional regulator [Skermanella mucosa]
MKNEEHVLRIGIASREEIQARTLAIVRGDIKTTAEEPKIWFTSIESLAQVLSTRNKLLLELISEAKPRSMTELAALSGRKIGNLSRTLHTMERYGLVQLRKEPGGAVRPVVPYSQVKLDLSLGHFQAA